MTLITLAMLSHLLTSNAAQAENQTRIKSARLIKNRGWQGSKTEATHFRTALYFILNHLQRVCKEYNSHTTVMTTESGNDRDIQRNCEDQSVGSHLYSVVPGEISDVLCQTQHA